MQKNPFSQGSKTKVVLMQVFGKVNEPFGKLEVLVIFPSSFWCGKWLLLPIQRGLFDDWLCRVIYRVRLNVSWSIGRRCLMLWCLGTLLWLSDYHSGPIENLFSSVSLMIFDQLLSFYKKRMFELTFTLHWLF